MGAGRTAPGRRMWSDTVGLSLRSRGDPVRSLTDCLIAATALRCDVTLWHGDTDLQWIAEVAHLEQLHLR